MNLASIILPRLSILKVRFKNESEYELALIQKSTIITNIDQIRKSLKRDITAIYIEGFGVLNKPCDSFIAKQVIENEVEFLSSIDSNKSVWFIRKSTIDTITERPKLALHISCLPLTQNYESTYERLINFNLLFSLKVESAIIHQAIINKLFKPIIIVTFIALVCSYIFSNSQYNDIEQYSSRIENLKKITSKSIYTPDNMTKQLVRITHYEYHNICNIIGIATPLEITLNNLTINPLTKPLQQEKELQLDLSTMVIKGQCDSINIATTYIDILRRKYFNNKVEMTTSDYNLKKAIYEFTITIKL